MTQSQILKMVAGIVAVVLIGVGVGVYSMVRSMQERMSGGTPTPVASPFEDPSWLRPAFEAELDDEWLASVCKITFKKGSVELVAQRDGIARRYTSGGGKILRRGGASLVAAEPFDLRELDLSLVPQIVADAQERSGSGIGAVIVGRDEEGLLLWRAIPKGEAADVYYLGDGSFVPDPDDP